MQATAALEHSMATALGADTTTLAEATTFVRVNLVKAAFSPSPDTTISDVTLADFDGATPKHAASASTQVFSDVLTGDTIIQVREPAGGWHFETSGTTNLPQTIHGYVLTDSTGATVWGSALLDEPVELTAVGQGLDIGQVRFRFASGSLS